MSKELFHSNDKNINLSYSEESYETLLDAVYIRKQANRLVEICLNDKGHFVIDESKLNPISKFTSQVIDNHYPNGNIPYHGRYGHLRVGGVDRILELEKLNSDNDKIEVIKSKIDLVVVSVLLDAGAGPSWQYRESNTGMFVSRSEGLAVASYHMFIEGVFSSELGMKFRADSSGLLHLTKEKLEQGFQVSVGNPLVGLKGRLDLLHSLGKVMLKQPELYGSSYPRVGNILDYMSLRFKDKKIPANDFLKILLKSLNGIWPPRAYMDKLPLGDVWYHSGLGEIDDWKSYQPFHKLTQWLAYSLLEVFEEAGFEFIELNHLTGLPEYRNGGLLIDGGLLKIKNEYIEDKYFVHSPLIVEWRALTVFYLDRIHDLVCEIRGVDSKSFPLAKTLEGGTWWAGRKIALEKRTGGGPPIQIVSDGTVF